ncbi:MAG TPA: riboflavin synthase [Edaphocola sp.]|nr:riboflavin synthase [Edaphocola sp.]
MFTGIVEATGILRSVEKDNNNIHFFVESPISHELRPDQSVAHDGVCLTVTSSASGGHWVTAVAETLQKTNLSEWSIGREINLERAMKLGDRLDGHLVQGHVDGVAVCVNREGTEGNCVLRFEFPGKFAALVIEKGSVCVNGVSLTAFDVAINRFSVTIIPYTLAHTSLKNLLAGQNVNLEYDLLGKYFLRRHEVQTHGS